jgi:hypothetical protein
LAEGKYDKEMRMRFGCAVHLGDAGELKGVVENPLTIWTQ